MFQSISELILVLVLGVASFVLLALTGAFFYRAIETLTAY